MEISYNPVVLDDSLNIRVKVGAQLMVVRFSHEALSDHFGFISTGDASMVQFYIQNSEAIDAAARMKMVPGVAYTRGSPLVIHTTDL